MIRCTAPAPDRKKTGAIAAFACATALSACGNNAEPAAEDSLSPAEATGLAYGIARLTAVGPPVSDTTFACPRGGTAAVSGSVAPDPLADSILAVNLVMGLTQCGMDVDDVVFTLDGAPGVNQQGTTIVHGFFESIDLAYEITGGFDWRVANPSRAGSCPLDMDLTGRGEIGTDGELVLSGTVAGDFCGVNVSLPLDSIGR